MGEPSVKDSWESHSSTFSSLEASASQDSCFGSDETSVTSALSSTPATSTAPSFVPSPKQSLSPILKPILKHQNASFEADTESESGYDSDAEFEYSFSVENDNEDSYAASARGQGTEDASETHSDDESGDDSFISFESAVRFDPKVEYIEAPETADDEITEAEMTFHEMVELAATSGHLLLDGGVPEGNNADEDEDPMAESEEHTPDAVDLDKRLFAAYINGINGIGDPDYKSHLRTRVDDIKAGRAETPFLDSDNAVDVYLDTILSHVIGVFRNLVAEEEFDELTSLSDEKITLQQQGQSPGGVEACNKALLDKIEGVLTERLGEGNVEIGAEELGFFAGGVAYALGNSDDAETEADAGAE
ncbi:hypothetical protein PHISP_05850 [Aspergillus sp. HF37]|nr:hypothetical protein PHISP_05850 [Aspergillus sp. HF37]